MSESGPLATVPSAAGRYNPAYYVVVGSVTRVADGVAGSYLLRGASALGCLAFLTVVLVGMRRWADPRWIAATLLAVTPTFIYSTTVVAPNGLEMMAGLGLWVGLAGMASVPFGEQRRHLLTAGASAAVLVTLRSLGPLWALLIVTACLVAWPGLVARLRTSLKTPAGLGALCMVAVAGVSSVGWTLSQQSLVVSRDGPGGAMSLGFRSARSLQEVPLWVLQAIAAFPFRNQPAPLIVYPCFIVVLSILLVVGLRSARSRLRAAAGLTLVGGLGIPLVITMATIDEFGTAWQGRYALPLLVGVMVLAGAGWAGSRRSYGLTLRSSIPIGVALVVVHAAGVSQVAADMAAGGDWVSKSGTVPHLPASLVAIVAVVAASTAVGAVLRQLIPVESGEPADWPVREPADD